MDIAQLSSLERFVPESLRQASWLRPRYPLVGVELRDDAVVATRLVRRKGRYHLAGHGRKELPAGVFTTDKMAPRVTDLPGLGEAVQTAMRLAGAEGVSQISLALPDTVARAFLLDFQDLPGGGEQAADMIRWRLKKSVPFDLGSARLSWQELGRGEDGRHQLLVAVVPREGLDTVEELLEGLGYRTGLIDLASFALHNALRLEGLLAGDTGQDFGLLAATPSYFSLLIQRGERLIFYRAKGYHVQGGFQGEESLRVVGRELRTSLSYYEEHLLGGGIERLYVHSVGVDAGGIRQVAEEAGCGRVLDAAAERVVPELGGLGDEEQREILPTLGLALRREP